MVGLGTLPGCVMLEPNPRFGETAGSQSGSGDEAPSETSAASMSDESTLSAADESEESSAGPRMDVGGLDESTLYDGLVALYSFDGEVGEGVVAVVDLMGSGSDTTSVTDDDATMTYTPGIVDQSVYFDGAEDQLVITAAAGTFDFESGDFTMSAWLKTSDSCGPVWCNLVGGGEELPGIALETTAADVVNFYAQGDDGYVNTVFESGGTPATTINDGAWHQLVGCRSGNDLVLYVDGVEDQRAENSFSGAVNVPRLVLGDAYQGMEVAFEVDEVALWNRALSPAEIQLLFATVGLAD